MEREAQLPAPSDLLRQFRRSYTNFRARWNTPAGVPEGVVLSTLAESPLSVQDLPAAARDELEAYRERHPDRRFTVVKYARFVDGDPRTVVEDDTGLPPEGELVTVSQTVTVTGPDEFRVVTDLFVLRRE
jgi:hypothetical protein